MGRAAALRSWSVRMEDIWRGTEPPTSPTIIPAISLRLTAGRDQIIIITIIAIIPAIILRLTAEKDRACHQKIDNFV